ncbi:hypothetical protein SETIT_4G080500v2 [Setaria italica]|uniref:DUF829 domain-containing protein n=1 Tax=Setaria italica TaxID=4555 RepID=K3XXB0_SETIT|nr:uncharacterized protein LOC101771616 [Setaria italica]RCV20729.1 hypothetical protein SETIT_4G080500v2 [Setaria italica]
MWPGCGGRFYWAPESAPPGQARGVAVVFAWVWSDEAQLRPFVELYASLGWRCLVCHPDLVALYLSEKATSLATGIISELVKELKVKPLPTVLASFSGGSKGCMYKVIQLLDGRCEGDATMKDYRLVRNCICGQIYDSSPVEFTSDVGTQFLQKSAVGNSFQSSVLRSWMAKALASGMDTLFPSRIEAQRAEYWHTLYSSAGLGPVLIFCSEDDNLAPSHVICGFARRLIELGTDVKLMKWSDSQHVGHYNSHEAEYRTAVNDMLKKALITFCHRSQLYDSNMAGDREYKIAHSVCSLHNAAANSNESLRRVANSPSDHFFLPSSKDHDESREPGSLIEDQRRHLSHPPSMEPKGVLGQILFDVCVPKNVEGWDIKPTVSSNGRPTFASARQLGPFNPIKYFRRSRL